MTPSAEEREWAEREAQKLAAISFRQASAIKTMLLATRRAGLDIGAKAERERIVAALRHDNEDLDDLLTEVFWPAWDAAHEENKKRRGLGQAGVATCQFLPQLRAAISDYLERQP